MSKTKNDADLKLFAAFRLLESNNLLYFKVLKKLNFIIDPKFKYIGAVGFNQKNKKIYMILQEKAMINGVDEDMAALLEHECGHILYEHIFKSKEEVSSEFKNLDLLNQAQDYIINDSCHYIVSRVDYINDLSNKSILAGGCFYKNIQEKIEELKNIGSDELTSKQLYKILEKNQSKSKGKSLDSHEGFEIVEDSDGNESCQPSESAMPTDSKELQEIAKEIFSKAVDELKKEGNLNKAIGQLSGQMKILVTEMIRSKTDKNSIFNFVNKITYGVKKKWSKLHTRYPYIAKGKRKNKKPNIGMVIDTSGSMGVPELFGMIKFQIKALSTRCETFYIILGDTKLEKAIHIKGKNSLDIENLEFIGGGGTNLQFGWDFAKEKGLDGLIIHTDGHIGSFDTHGVKSIFYLYGDGANRQEGLQNIMVYPD